MSTPVEIARALTAERQRRESREANEPPPVALPSKQAIVSAPPAAVPTEIVAPTRFVDLLMFQVGTESFAMDLAVVEEVIDLPIIHFVPEMPPSMLGVVAIRGLLTPVYSPGVALGVLLSQRNAALVIRHARGKAAIIIDDVNDAIRFDMRELHPAVNGQGSAGVVIGVGRRESTLVTVIDAGALIAACQSVPLLETA